MHAGLAMAMLVWHVTRLTEVFPFAPAPTNPARVQLCSIFSQPPALGWSVIVLTYVTLRLSL